MRPVTGFETPGEILGRLAAEHQARQTKTTPGTWPRVDLWLVAAVTLATITAVAWFLGIRAGIYWAPGGGDFDVYRNAAASWLGGGPFYRPWQMVPYDVWDHPVTDLSILYPPTILPLLAAFTVLPGFLWWALPAAITVWALRDVRGWKLLVVIALVLWPPGIVYVWTGNPSIWIVALLALARRHPGVAPWVLLKPSLLPFAFFRAHRREWWIGLALYALLGLAFLPMWADWLTVVLNGTQPAGLLYSLTTMPVLGVCLVPVERRPA